MDLSAEIKAAKSLIKIPFPGAYRYANLSEEIDSLKNDLLNRANPGSLDLIHPAIGYPSIFNYLKQSAENNNAKPCGHGAGEGDAILLLNGSIGTHRDMMGYLLSSLIYYKPFSCKHSKAFVPSPEISVAGTAFKVEEGRAFCFNSI